MLCCRFAWQLCHPRSNNSRFERARHKYRRGAIVIRQPVFSSCHFSRFVFRGNSDLTISCKRPSAFPRQRRQTWRRWRPTAADVTALDAARSTFDTLRNARRTAISEQKGTTMTLPEIIRTARSISRNQIDKLVTKYRKSNPEFYRGYFAVRTIVDRRGGQSTPVTPGPTPAKP
jgi:hypothetical protein